MIKLEALRVFVTVAEAGNIKTAADQLGRTASAISMTLKQLEADVGGQLFQTDRKNELTSLGSFILETGRVQIRNFDRAVNKIRAYAKDRIGHLSVASVPSVASNLLPLLLPAFLAERHEIDIELYDFDSRTVCQMVESGVADIGIGSAPNINSPLSFAPLLQDRFVVICKINSHLANKGATLDWSDLKAETMIRNGASETIAAPEYRALAERATMTVYNVTSLIALARAGVGVTLLPALAALHLPDDVVGRNLTDQNTVREVGLIERRGVPHSPIALAFRQYLLARIPGMAKSLGLSNEAP